MSDVIAAIATARGVAALAIIRVSGPGAVALVNAGFKGQDLEAAGSHTAHVGYFLDAEGTEIDQVVVTLFKAPRSVTGEDVVEISSHGGDFASQLILRSLLDRGARMAAPGEFTQRAFLNGKMDLAQAEAVADLIHASSSMAHKVSLNHIKGRYSDQLDRLRDELIELCAYIELEMDFVEEDVEFADKSRLVELLNESIRLLNQLQDSYHLGSMIRDGVRVVIAGRPNAGKSTLLNALVGRDRAIVSDIPGTTRDEIEAEAEIDGVRYRFTDTAGLREASDVIEAEGVRRAEQSAQAADMLIYVVDATVGLDEGEQKWLSALRSDHVSLPIILVANKSDQEHALVPVSMSKLLAIPLSAQKALREVDLLKPLVDAIKKLVTIHLHRVDGSPVVMNQRHRHHLHKALAAVMNARAALDYEVSMDALVVDLRVALHELGQITGKITNEDVLDQIFSRFCIGK